MACVRGRDDRRLGRLVASVEHLRRQWIDAERPAASYCLQGLLSGIDWARDRGEEELLERWVVVATEIVGRFDPSHPVAGLASVIRLDMEGLADIVEHPGRYPDRQHYVEHVVALCADRADPVAMASIDALVARAERSGMQLLEAQARRLRGVLARDDDDLAQSLAMFEAVGAARYAARVRTELGLARGDDALVKAGSRQLEAMGDDGQLGRLASRAS